MDMLLTILFWVFQAAITVLGIYVSLKPPPETRHRRFIVAFILLALCGGAVNVMQSRRASKLQDDLKSQLNKIRMCSTIYG
jgi:hypothetical protein